MKRIESSPAIAEELFWTAVRKELAQTGRTQEWLADELGVEPSIISKWMRGKEGISLRDAFAIARLLDLSLSDLVFTARPVSVVTSCACSLCERIMYGISTTATTKKTTRP